MYSEPTYLPRAQALFGNTVRMGPYYAVRCSLNT